MDLMHMPLSTVIFYYCLGVILSYLVIIAIEAIDSKNERTHDDFISLAFISIMAWYMVLPAYLMRLLGKYLYKKIRNR